MREHQCTSLEMKRFPVDGDSEVVTVTKNRPEKSIRAVRLASRYSPEAVSAIQHGQVAVLDGEGSRGHPLLPYTRTTC